MEDSTFSENIRNREEIKDPAVLNQIKRDQKVRESINEVIGRLTPERGFHDRDELADAVENIETIDDTEKILASEHNVFFYNTKRQRNRSRSR